MTSSKIIAKHLSVFVLCAVTSLCSLHAVAETDPQPSQENGEPRDGEVPPVILEGCPMFPMCDIQR